VRLGRPTPTALRALRTFAVAAFLLVVDPFDFSESLDRAGRDAFYKVMAPTFASDDVGATVVLVDDEFLRANTSYWPLPYLAHAEIVRTIAAAGPSAIFVDVAFVDELPDPTLTGFIEILSGVADSSPVFLAAASSETGAVREIRREFAALAEHHPNVTLVSVLVGQGIDGRAYQLAPDAAGRPSAAWALHTQVCRSTNTACSTGPPTPLMEIVWPLPAASNCASSRGAELCRRVSRHAVVRAARFLIGGALGSLSPTWLREPDPIIVPGVPVIAANSVVRGSNQAAVRDALAGQTVFYGARLALATDLLDSPINGAVPGVFAHATAFANLRVYGDRYVRTDPPFGLPDVIHELVLLAIATAAAFAVLSYLHGVQAGAVRRITLQIGAVIMFAIVLTVIEYGLLRSSPANWWGIMGALAASRWTVGRAATQRV